MGNPNSSRNAIIEARVGVEPCTVVNLNTEGHDVYIGRPGRGEPGPFGNPFRVGSGLPNGCDTREETIAAFQAWFRQRLTVDLDFLNQVLGLRGKRLGCFCKPLSCHGDHIAEFVNAVETHAVAMDRPVASTEVDLPRSALNKSCSICATLMFTQAFHLNRMCPGCGRHYCYHHSPRNVHACYGGPK